MINLRVCPLLLHVFFFGFVANAGHPLRVELADGSQILVTPASDVLPVTSEDLNVDLEIPYKRISRVETTKQGNHIRIEFCNGDRLTARHMRKKLKFKSLIGIIHVPVRHIHHIESQRKNSPTRNTKGEFRTGIAPSEFQLDFASLRWDLWRTQWQVEDEKLTAIGKIRPGFRYGHWGNGRGGMVITGNGNQDWRDYEVAFDFHMMPATRAFYHAHIPGDSRGMTVFLRAKSVTESWNEPDTSYAIGVNPTGGWSLSAYQGFHYVGNQWSPNRAGKIEQLVKGKTDSPLRDSANRLRFRVQGTTITIWINGQQVARYVHKEGGEIPPIPYGGFGVQWRYESLGSISNLTVKPL